MADYRHRLSRYAEWASARGLLNLDEPLGGLVTFFYDGLPQECRMHLLERDVIWNMEGVYGAAVEWERRQAVARLAQTTSATFAATTGFGGSRAPSGPIPQPRPPRTDTPTPPGSVRPKQGRKLTRQDAREKQGPSRAVSQVPPSPGESLPVSKEEEFECPGCCSGCREVGHVHKDCPYYDTRCMKCGQTGHTSRHCSYVHGHTDFDDFGDDAAVNMVLMQETDLPEDPRPLTPQECAEYVESLGAAPFWSELSDEGKASCFQAEVVEEIPEGRIPSCPSRSQAHHSGDDGRRDFGQDSL